MIPLISLFMRCSYPVHFQVNLQKTTSLCSISHLSTTGSLKHEVEVPELTFGPNPRLPSASAGIDLQFSPERGRFFVATRDLGPGENKVEWCTVIFGWILIVSVFLQSESHSRLQGVSDIDLSQSPWR